MQSLTRSLPRIDWPMAGVILANLGLALATLVGFTHGADWAVIERAAAEAGTLTLYTDRGTGTFVWSPVTAHLLNLIVPLGLVGWRVVLVATALAMPTWAGRILVLSSWPFWTDFTTGNMVTVIFVAAVWALKGSRFGTFAFFSLALLIPRPLLVPAVLWMLLQRPHWRWPFAGMFIVHAALILWTGLGTEWMHTVLTTGSELQALIINLSPTRFMGYGWLWIGIPLAVWLFWRGHVGWAGLAISNYVWIYYLYFAFPQVNGQRERQIGGSRASRGHETP